MNLLTTQCVSLFPKLSQLIDGKRIVSNKEEAAHVTVNVSSISIRTQLTGSHDLHIII